MFSNDISNIAMLLVGLCVLRASNAVIHSCRTLLHTVFVVRASDTVSPGCNRAVSHSFSDIDSLFTATMILTVSAVLLSQRFCCPMQQRHRVPR